VILAYDDEEEEAAACKPVPMRSEARRCLETYTTSLAAILASQNLSSGTSGNWIILLQICFRGK
jgi:hypothetical protein